MCVFSFSPSSSLYRASKEGGGKNPDKEVFPNEDVGRGREQEEFNCTFVVLWPGFCGHLLKGRAWVGG